MKVIKDADFEQEVMKSELPVVVDFFAEWCGPCKMLGPVFEALSEEFQGRVSFVKFDVDGGKEIPARYSVMSVPTLLFFNNGEKVDQVVGFVPQEAIAEKIKQNFGL